MLPKIYFFKKFHLHTSLEKYKRCSRKIFLFFSLTVTYNNILGVHSRFFTPDTPIISLFGIIQ